MGRTAHLFINKRFEASDKLAASMAYSLLPGLRDILTQDEIDKIDGPLRRGDISVLQHPLILEKLDLMRRGVMNNSNAAFSRLYQFSSFLKKYPTKGNDLLCKEKALEKFKLGEQQCEETNKRLLTARHKIDSHIGLAQQIIETILGPIDSDYLDTKVCFGPGSTVNVDGRGYSETGKYFKYTDRLVVPRRQRFHLAAHLSSQAAWMDTLRIKYRINDYGNTRFEIEKSIFNEHFDVRNDNLCNKITFVPKNADEHRTIGVEPNGSILLQKVLGNLIRQRLAAFGLNLNSQARNVHFARVAKTFKFATLDIANASNTLSYEAVRLLLPSSWFTQLDCLRSQYGECKEFGYRTKYSMFSSMGNGFTFELESLIFYALSLAVVLKANGYNMALAKRNVAVYGDDLIVPQECADVLIEELNYIGFKVNREKSFFGGNFFESCGSDFYDSVDVRPFFLKRQIKTVRDSYFVLNSLLFKSVKTGNSFLFPAYLTLLKHLSHLGKPDLAPLGFTPKARNGFREVTDDLEAALRVPLSYARAHGAVSFDTKLFAWKYKKWVRLAIEVPSSRSLDYDTQSVKYLTFLDGTLGGKAVYSGDGRLKLVTRHSSSWDGMLNGRELSLICSLLGT